jgi:amidase
MADPWRLTARAAKAALDRGELSATELVESCLARIAAEDGELRAFITLGGERALREARASDQRRTSGAAPRPLEGLPFAVKDVTATAGVRTTYGSRVHVDHVPVADELCVARLRKAGAILVGKTNTPEFGFGPHSINALCGPTLNPHDRWLSSGGSSGGSAVAVASGMAPLAQGTDFGGSLRTPASFCGTVGLRPTPGLIPAPDKPPAWNALVTHGVLARAIDDAVLMLSAMVGFEARDPLSHPLDGSRLVPLGNVTTIPRLAFSADLGVAPISKAVRAVFGRAIAAIEALYAGIEEATPDCADATQAFATLRAAIVHWQFAGLARRQRAILTEPFLWNVDRGHQMTADAFLAAEEQRSRTYAAFLAFFDRLPVDAQRLRNAIRDHSHTYCRNRWASVIEPNRISHRHLLGVACGSAKHLNPLPVDRRRAARVQIIAAPHADAALLAFARHLERTFRVCPPLAHVKGVRRLRALVGTVRSFHWMG